MSPANSQVNPGERFKVFTGFLVLSRPIMVRNSLEWRGCSLFHALYSAGQRWVVATARTGPLYSRRLISRVETAEAVWVCWRCQGAEDVSRVCDLSVGGLFLSTPIPRPLGAKARLDFLIPEGPVRAEAVVRHVIPGGGLGLQFTAITDQDCPHLVALLNRICTPSPPQSPAGRTSASHSRG